MDIRKDILGRKPKIGDIIVYNPPYYKGIIKGFIVSFTKSGLPILNTMNSGITPKTGFAIVDYGD